MSYPWKYTQLSNPRFPATSPQQSPFARSQSVRNFFNRVVAQVDKKTKPRGENTWSKTFKSTWEKFRNHVFRKLESLTFQIGSNNVENSSSPVIQQHQPNNSQTVNNSSCSNSKSSTLSSSTSNASKKKETSEVRMANFVGLVEFV